MTKRSKIIALTLFAALVVTQMGNGSCGGSGTNADPVAAQITAIKVKIDQAAKSLNTAAHSNHDLYEAGTYGAKGSAGAIATRQKVAKGIHEGNEYLIQAINFAKTITPATIGGGKTQVLQFISQAISTLAANHIGNDKIDLILQAVAATLNEAIILVQALKG